MDLITFSSGALSGRVIGFRGTEKMSRPYQFEVFLQTGAELDLKAAAGAKATVAIDRGTEGSVPFYFSGVLSNVEVVYAYEAQTVVQATLVPKLWELSLSRHSRMFTMMRIPDIITLVLAENGVVEVELRLSGSYSVEEHVCQYRESDLDFISRWMEKEGIFYFFEHGPEGERLVLCDSLFYDMDPLGGLVAYHPQLVANTSHAPGLRTFGGGQRTLPQQVRVTDYNYMMPNMPLTGASPVQPTGAGEVVLFGERFFDPGSGQKYAMLRAQEMLARECVARGKGSRMHLRPGYVFTVDGHPVAQFNAPFVAIEARHSVNHAAGDPAFRELIGISHDELYHVEVEAIPAEKQFRAQSVTPWPRINGFSYGVIDAAGAGPYAFIDDQGRYNVRFKFDESSLPGGQASTFVRMMQPHGGDVEGFHFPLRKGMEVLIVFLDGDPDRPMIFGVGPNATKPSPVTASNNTRNIIQTGGRNRLEFEDQAGSQWVHLSTPSQRTHLFLGATGVNAGFGSSGGDEGQHNFVLETEGTGHLHTQGKWDVNVEDALNETVTSDVTEQYGSNTSQTVQGTKKHTIMGQQTESLMGGREQSILSSNQRSIVGTYTQTHQGDHSHNHIGSWSHTHLGSHEHTHLGSRSHNHQGSLQHQHQGSWDHTHTGPWIHNHTGPWNHTHTGPWIHQHEGPYTHTQEGPYTTTRTGPSQHTQNGPHTQTHNGPLNNVLQGPVTNYVFGIKEEHKADSHINTNWGIKLDTYIGLAIAINVVGKYQFTLGGSIDMSAFKFSATGLDISMKMFKMDSKGFELKNGAFQGSFKGFFIFG